MAALQGGLGLPDRDYYTKTDEESKGLRTKYVAHVAKMLELAGDAPATAAEEAKTILEFETKLAVPAMTRVERRNPDNTYHPYRGEELAKLTPRFSWTAYLRGEGVPEGITVNVWQPKFFEAVNGLLDSELLPVWKTYLRWQLVNAAAPSLSKKFVDEDFDFNQKTLQGTEENLPRWKRCVAATDQALGMALGKNYVRDHFPPQARERADRMVKNLVAALRDDLQNLPWMGAETRKAALAKLDAFAQKIGYPDKWRDYSSLSISRGPYAANVLAASVFDFRRDLAKVGKPVDRTDWEMTPPTVNAYYQPARNKIMFPAGILQPPFFNANADDAVNYGGIGAVIGHEMTHGFDDSGRKFDAQGNPREWWTPEDLKNFEARAKCVEKQFDAYVVEGDLHENGKLVLGESIADLGGVAIAHRAFVKSLEGKPAPPPDRRADGGPAFLPLLGANLGHQRPPGVRETDRQHQPAPARPLPGDRPSLEPAAIRPRLLLQDRRPDGPRRALRDLVNGATHCADDVACAHRRAARPDAASTARLVARSVLRSRGARLLRSVTSRNSSRRDRGWATPS